MSMRISAAAVADEAPAGKKVRKTYTLGRLFKGETNSFVTRDEKFALEVALNDWLLMSANMSANVTVKKSTLTGALEAASAKHPSVGKWDAYWFPPESASGGIPEPEQAIHLRFERKVPRGSTLDYLIKVSDFPDGVTTANFETTNDSVWQDMTLSDLKFPLIEPSCRYPANIRVIGTIFIGLD